MDRAEFAKQVEEALSHLYDQPFLQTHPFADLAVDPGRKARGQALQRVLTEAIQSLKPGVRLPYDSLAWRKYRYLYLRHVEALEPVRVAQELGVSLRQSYRYQREGLEALVSMLWDRRRDASSAGGTGSPPAEEPGGGTGPIPGQGSSLLEEEVARFGDGLRSASVDLREVVDGVLSTVTPLARSRGITLAVTLGESPRPVAERGALRQALLSLLLLTIEQSAGLVELAVGRDSDEPQLTLRVPGSADKVPLPPAQLQQTEGFRVAEQLLPRHSLALAVESLPAGGFAIRVGLRSSRPVKVLMIEDNLDVVHLFRRYLSARPYEVVAASSGQEAVRLGRESPPSVIILDLVMPGQDGWETLQMLKSHPGTQRLPVVVCSVLHQRDLALLLGACDFLVKPVSQESLLDALERCCQQTESAGRPDWPAGNASTPLSRDLAGE